MQTNHPVGGVRLSELLPRSRFFGTDDICVTACCAAANACQPGDLFVAVNGAQNDGHQQVQQAVSHGARAVLAERLVPANIPQCIVPDTRTALGRLCHALAGDPSEHLHVVGITGTAGKTSSQMLIAAIIEAAGHHVAVHGDLGYSDGATADAAAYGIRTAAELAKWLAEARANGCTHAVVEASSDALAARRFAGLKLDAAILTNLRRDHLDVHGSVLNYRRAKLRLLDQLKATGVAVINADDPGCKAVVDRIRHPLLTVGMETPGELSATVIERHKSEQTFLLQAGSDTAAVRTQTIGDAHVYNCLTAAAATLVMGIDLGTIVRGLESLPFVPGRLQRVECGQSFGVFVDVGPTPESLAESLRTLRRVTDGRVICVFGEGPLRAADARPRRGRVVERLADLAVITSDDADDPQPLQAAHDLLDGFDRPAQAHLLPNRIKAICWALAEAQRGDTVLIAGPHGGIEQLSSPAGQSVSDVDVARYWLYEAGADQTCPWVPV